LKIYFEERMTEVLCEYSTEKEKKNIIFPLKHSTYCVIPIFYQQINQNKNKKRKKRLLVCSVQNFARNE